MTAQEVKLQEAIYELVCGEEDLVKDLLMIQKNYADPMVQLHILSSAEVRHKSTNLGLIPSCFFAVQLSPVLDEFDQLLSFLALSFLLSINTAEP